MKFDLKTPLIIACICATMLLGVLAGRTYNALYGHNEVQAEGVYAIVPVSPGMNVQDIAEFLEAIGVIERSKDFIFAARFLKFEQSIQAGEYVLPFGESNWALLSRLVNAGSSASLITIPEGYTVKQIASLLNKKINLSSDAFMYAVRDSTLLKKYGIEAPSFEGFLFPDSYNFYRSMSTSWIIDQFARRFFEVYDSTMQARAEELGLSLTEVVTLASIIEGEMIYKSEATVISAVYHNRLKKKMRLQADPTIQYIISDGPRRLLKRDLKIRSPYNTYMYRGLPPGPVCNPGEAALSAALYPDDKTYLYMVAQGDGSHAFNVNFSGHLRDKAKLDSLRAALAQSKKSYTSNDTPEPAQ
jgi:UPF0755 protein